MYLGLAVAPATWYNEVHLAEPYRAEVCRIWENYVNLEKRVAMSREVYYNIVTKRLHKL